MALQDCLKVPFNPTFSNRQTDEELLKSELEYVKNLTPSSNLPASMVNQMSDREMLVDESGKKICIKYFKGTTTLSFKYKGGICIAVDSRATGGQFIASGTVQKYIPINRHLIGTLAGGAADCQYWERVLSLRCRMHELRNREPISTAAASKLFANLLYGYKGMGLSAGVMICGYDKKGPSIYYVNNDGDRLSGDLFSVGSGSTYAYGSLDSNYRYDMEDEEAFDLARRAIYHATFRDIASGGIVRVLSIKEDGWKLISETDCKDLHYMYQEQKMQN